MSEREIIKITNHFYLEMSKNVLTEKEYDIAQKILTRHYSFRTIAAEYGTSKGQVKYIYQKVFFKIKSVAGLVEEINFLKERKNKLYRQYETLMKEKQELDAVLMDKKIIDSCFPFSKGLWSLFIMLEIHTFKNLFERHLSYYPSVRRFTGRYLAEFIRFIEFESIEEFFEDDFYEFKEKYKYITS